jgi:cell wall-associated NlpC family hydrolase
MATKITAQDRELIIKIAKLYLGSPYLFGANGTLPGEAMDCSRFTQIVLENVGITLERNSSMQ